MGSCMGSVSVSSCRCCRFVSCVHHVAVLNAAFCMPCSLLMLVEDGRGILQRWSHNCLIGLVGVFVFNVMWSELLMTSTICYPLWIVRSHLW